jgi:chromosome segregation ATPase
MNEDDEKLLVATSERAKSNTHQIEDLKDRMDKLEEKTEDIHKIATSIEVVCNDISYIKEGQNTLNTKFDKLSDKVDDQGKNIRNELEVKVADVQTQVDKLHDEPYDEFKNTKHAVKVNVLGRWLSDLGIALVGVLGTLLATGVIKL